MLNDTTITNGERLIINNSESSECDKKSESESEKFIIESDIKLKKVVNDINNEINNNKKLKKKKSWIKLLSIRCLIYSSLFLIILALVCYKILKKMVFNNYDFLNIKISELKISNQTNIIIFIIPENLNASKSTLYMYKQKSKNYWMQKIKTNTYISKNGLGDNIEKNNKTPYGIYNFTIAFGIEKNIKALIPYIKLNETIYWNKDNKSDKYNQLVSIDNYNNFNINISEHLINYVDKYKYAISINYNPNNLKYKKAGIFLNCKSNHNYNTSSSIEVDDIILKKILEYIDNKTALIIDLENNINNY